MYVLSKYKYQCIKHAEAITAQIYPALTTCVLYNGKFTMEFIYITSSCVVTTVMFEKLAYNISENNAALVVPVFLSRPSSTEFTVEVYNKDITASGKTSL